MGSLWRTCSYLIYTMGFKDFLGGGGRKATAFTRKITNLYDMNSRILLTLPRGDRTSTQAGAAENHLV